MCYLVKHVKWCCNHHLSNVPSKVVVNTLHTLNRDVNNTFFNSTLDLVYLEYDDMT